MDSPKHLSRWCLAGLLALTLLVHGRDVFHQFIDWDDKQMVTGNELLNPVTGQHLAMIWSKPTLDLYTPLAYSAWSAVAAVWPRLPPDSLGDTLAPLPFHLLNVLLHLACVAVVFDVLQRVLESKDESERSAAPSVLLPPSSFLLHPSIAAAFGAAIFAVHPLQVEAVAWVAGMNNVLAGLFSLLTMAAYLRFSAPGATRKPLWYGLALLALTAALLSKPTAIVTPLMLLALDVLVLQRPWKKSLVALSPLVLLAIPFVLIGRSAQPADTLYAPPIGMRPVVAGDAIGFYLCKLVWPTKLLMEYGRTPRWVLAQGGTAGPWIALVIAAIILYDSWTKRRWLVGLFAMFVAGVALVLGLVPFAFQNYSTVADRYVYLSMLAPSIGVAIGLVKLARQEVLGVAGAIIAALALLSFFQAERWQNTMSIADYTLSLNPYSLAANGAGGIAYADRGIVNGDKDAIAIAEAYYQRGLRTQRDNIMINYDYGNLLLNTNRPAEAIEHYRTAERAGDDKTDLYTNLSLALYGVGRYQEAIDVMQTILKTDPGNFNTWINLGTCMGKLGRLEEAESDFRQALTIDPNSAKARRGMANVQALRTTSQPATTQPH